MPTARELLEQADALMRRNRERAEAERAAATDTEPPPVAAPDVVEVEVHEVPDDGANLGEARRDDAREDDIPELTDVVEADATRVVDLRPIVSELDDVPELTDAVEEIEAPSILEAPEDEGEPSQWLEIERGEVSVTGPAPDSVVAVPTAAPLDAGEVGQWLRSGSRSASPVPASAAARAAAYAAETRAPETPTFAEAAAKSGVDEVGAAGTTEIVADLAGPAEPLAEAIDVPETAVVTVLDVADEILEASGDEAASAVAAAEVAEALAATEAAAIEPETGAGEPVEAAGPVEEFVAMDAVGAAAPAMLQAGDEVAAPASVLGVAAEPLVGHGMEAVIEPVPDATSAVPTAGETVVAAPDALHWDVLAEEIRMQVLQRIDIFTDTGLREQLAASLQPIVDRASAELVATINREVGRLLRSYVAEAIEREIDKWRQEGG